MSRLSSLNNKKSTEDNPTKLISDEPELHLSVGEQMNVMNLLPERVQRTRFINHYNLEPLPQIPHYIQLPTYAFPLWQAIHDEVLNEQDRKGYEIVPLRMPISRFLREHKFKNDVIIGKNSITDRKNKVRYLTQIPYTVTDCAKAYIRICEFSSGKRLEPQYNKHKDVYRRKRGIKYFSGYHKGNFAYIDMESAYWSILWPTTIDMQYDHINQEIASEGNICYQHCDQFRMFKQVRLVLHTLFGYRDMRIWHPDEGRIRPGNLFQDALYRPFNLGYVHDVMNAIVSEIKEKFTLYQWLTDAAIVPENQGEALVEFLREEWFINSRIKYKGEGYSNRIDSYAIGNYHTRGFNRRIVGVEHNGLYDANIKGLKELRQQAKNGTLPEIRKISKKARISRTGVALHTGIPVPPELIPRRQRLIAPRRNTDPMNRNRNAPPPESDFNYQSKEDILNKFRNDI